MSAKERIKTLDNLWSHYTEHQFNTLENYKNQLSIFIGVENDSYSYSETLLQPELILHPMYEAIYNENEDFVNEVETLNFEYKNYLKKFDEDKKNGIEDYDFLKEKLELCEEAIEKINQKIEWQLKKSQIHDLIFREKMPKNDAQVEQIKSILNSDFYNEIDSLPIAENVNKLLDAYVKVIPIYEKILRGNENSKPLKDVVKIIDKTQNIIRNHHNLYANKDSINDFLYLWKLKSSDEIVDANCKIANTNNLLYYINKNGWSDTVIVNECENNILISGEILVFDTNKINPNYILLLLNLPCYKEMGHCYYHRKNNPNAVLDFLIPIPHIDVQNYFSEAIDKYFYLNKKNIDIQKIKIEAESILKEQGEIAANYFLDLKIKKK